MNKSDIVRGLASGSKMTVAEVDEVVDGFLKAIGLSLWDGEDVLLSGFGKFAIRNRPTTKRRNPKTGELIDVPAKTGVTFLASPILKTKLNQGAQSNLVA